MMRGNDAHIAATFNKMVVDTDHSRAIDLRFFIKNRRFFHGLRATQILESCHPANIIDIADDPEIDVHRPQFIANEVEYENRLGGNGNILAKLLRGTLLRQIPGKVCRVSADLYQTYVVFHGLPAVAKSSRRREQETHPDP